MTQFTAKDHACTPIHHLSHVLPTMHLLHYIIICALLSFVFESLGNTMQYNVLLGLNPGIDSRVSASEDQRLWLRLGCGCGCQAIANLILHCLSKACFQSPGVHLIIIIMVGLDVRHDHCRRSPELTNV